MNMISRGTALAVAVTVASLAQPYTAQAADLFKGKTIKVSIGFGPGGGYDAFWRGTGAAISPAIPR
jgi:tripartite-type tricarboxylate transporter receptor subunit TctC